MGKEFRNLTEEQLCDLMCGEPEQDTMTDSEAVSLLEQLKAEIEWEYSLEYQIALEVAIERLKEQKNERMECKR